MEKDFTVYVSPPECKDYNDELINAINGNEQIAEHEAVGMEMCM